jgi:putative hydrolase of the HAD superfamily
LRRWRHIVAATLDDVTDPAACFAELYAHFARPSAWTCAPHAAEVLTGLAARYPLALASNYDRRLRSVAAGLDALGPIAHLVISSEVSWRKPARPFFDAVCAVLGLPPREILFVGDDLVNDYEGARAAGLKAVLYDPQSQATGDVVRVNDLRELLG